MKFSIILACVFLALLGALEVKATMDWSNLDLVNFQYFKERPTTIKPPHFFRSHGHLYSIRRIPDPPSKFQQTVSKTKAVLKYLKGVAFGNEEEKIRVMHAFNPDSGEKRNKLFEQKHGKFGERLVELVGSGPSYEKLIRAGAV